MKILINASILDDKLSGVGVYTIEVLKRLILELERDDIDYIVYSYDVSHLDFVPFNKRIQVEFPNKLEKKISKNRSIHRLLWNLFVLNKIAKNYSLVYSPSSHGCFKHQNQIITIHDLICLNYPFQNFMQFLYFKFLLPRISKNSLVIAISNYTRLETIKKFKLKDNKVIKIYNGANHLTLKDSVNLNFNDYSIPKNGLEQSKYFLTVGANLSHKNIFRLIDVAKRFGHTEYKFVIVGRDGPYFKMVKKRIESENMQNIILLNYVSNEDLVILYKYCFSNIYISLYEGFGFPPIEAALHDKISIVSKSTCLPEIYGDSVIYVDGYDVDDIFHKVKYLISNKDLILKSYSEKLKLLVNKYKWENTVAEIISLIKKND